ncbi:MAG TPA: bifunctional 4-hydroxy-2-oxoglutarate aldolase/2-dehydro-3-deoxy-phosphogluconate aldolase [Candidatus Limnocylindrales bacterium]
MVADPIPTDASPRGGSVAATIRRERLVAVLRRVEPRSRLIELVTDLAAAGVRIFEITFDAPDAVGDLVACRSALGDGAGIVGAGTVRTASQLREAADAGAAFAVAPVFDHAIVEASIRLGLPFIPAAFTPTEADAAWRTGATFVKLFPGSALGPKFVRELRGPLPEIETIVTGGVDASNARAFLDAGAIAVGVGGALVRASADERRAIVEAVAAE